MHHDIMFNIETKKTSKTTNHNMQTQGQSECENIIPTETTEEAKKAWKKEKATKPLQPSAPHALLPQQQQ